MYILDNHNNMHNLRLWHVPWGHTHAPCSLYIAARVIPPFHYIISISYRILKSPPQPYICIYEIHWLTHEGTPIPIPLIVPLEYLGNGRDHIRKPYLDGSFLVLFGVLRPTREFFAHMETLILMVGTMWVIFLHLLFRTLYVYTDFILLFILRWS